MHRAMVGGSTGKAVTAIGQVESIRSIERGGGRAGGRNYTRRTATERDMLAQGGKSISFACPGPTQVWSIIKEDKITRGEDKKKMGRLPSSEGFNFNCSK